MEHFDDILLVVFVLGVRIIFQGFFYILSLIHISYQLYTENYILVFIPRQQKLGGI